MRNWIVLAIIGFGGILFTLVGASVVSGKAKRANIEGAYQRRVRRLIDQQVYNHGLTRQDFETFAHHTLSGDAPLREQLFLTTDRTRSPFGGVKHG